MNSNKIMLIEKARNRWVKDLIDVSRRNRLLYFRETQGSVNFTEHDPNVLAKLLGGEKVVIQKLLRSEITTQIEHRLHKIQKDALTNLEEKGLDTLFLSLGLATWSPSDEGSAPNAPIILVPVQIESQGIWRSHRATLQKNGDVQFNSVLGHNLRTTFGVTVNADSLWSETPGEGIEDAPINAELVFKQLRSEIGSKVKAFSIRPDIFLSNMAYHKMAMVEDLQRSTQALSTHPLIAALAGDEAAQTALRQNRVSVEPGEIDQTPPDQEFLVLDADSSQQTVIATVLKGQHLVIQGPPGTGKSQTIANLIASLVAKGKKVLFVAEKRAALEVVVHRLERAGLGHLCLDLHSTDLSTRHIIRKLAKTRSIVSNALPVHADDVHRTYAMKRSSLNEHAEAMHKPRDPLAMSVYALQGKILELPLETRLVRLRLNGVDLGKMVPDNMRAIRGFVQQLADLSDIVLRRKNSAWIHVPFSTGRDVEESLAAIQKSYQENLQLVTLLEQFCNDHRLRIPESFEDCENFVNELQSVNRIVELYSEGLFELPLNDYQQILSKGKNAFTGAIAFWVNASYRRIRQQIQKLHEARGARRLGAAEHYQNVQDARQQLIQWQEKMSRESADSPRLLDIEGLRSRVQLLGNSLEFLRERLRQENLKTISLAQLTVFLSRFIDDIETPYQLIRVLDIESELRQRGASSFVNVIRDQKDLSHLWPEMFDFVVWQSSLDQARLESRNLQAFKGDTHAKEINEFRSTDQKRIALAVDRVKRIHAERVIAVENQFEAQAAIVRKEMEKSRRHRPIRKLLAEAHEIVLTYCPCWMASPLSVSQLLDSQRRYFDVVLFDEASQILPQDAIPAIMRSEQVIVAGDKHQLPPTTFFAGETNDDPEVDDETAGLDSLLDLMAAFVSTWSLQWHYRSHDEALIAFSNHHIYGDGLVTFPNSGGAHVLSHVLVPHVARDGQEDSVSDEVDQVVKMVLAHARERPDESLGVITMGIKHAQRIEFALDRALKQETQLDNFFDIRQDERFFVKNLERVQGDERDAIILSVGYGKSSDGRLFYRFGPLLQEGGERRLNVAVTRARKRMTLVSSFNHEDMDPNRSKAKGVELLRLYLQYAASQGSTLGERQSTRIPMNPFEEQVYRALTAKGIGLVPQWGVSKYRLDFAVRHPDRAGSFIMAIECDGASYHSAPTARDRDRLRQQKLESLGWNIYRIWSTDWFLNPTREIERVLNEYQRLIASSAVEDKTSERKRFSTPTLMEGEQTFESVLQVPSVLRKTRPEVPQRLSIDDYTDSQLNLLLNWIRSDGRLRTDAELFEEMVKELGYKRRGVKIERRLDQIIRNRK